QPLLLERGALAARPGPTSRFIRTLPAGAPPRLLGRAAVPAKCRLLARLLDRHGADPAHGAVDGPSHLDRGAHARPCAPRLRGLHAASPRSTLDDCTGPQPYRSRSRFLASSGSRPAWDLRPGPCWSTASSRARCACSPTGANK